MEELANVEIPDALKDFVQPVDLQHRDFIGGHFWQKIPAFQEVSKEEFYDTKWQNKNTVRKVEQLILLLEGLVADSFIEEVRAGMDKAPMNLSVSPYVLSLINWEDPINDPLRIQFHSY